MLAEREYQMADRPSLATVVAVLVVWMAVCPAHGAEWRTSGRALWGRGTTDGTEVSAAAQLQLVSFAGTNVSLRTRAKVDGRNISTRITDGNRATAWNFLDDANVLGRVITLDLEGNRLIDRVRVLPPEEMESREYFLKGYAIRLDGLEEGVGVGSHVAVEQDLSVAVEDAQVHWPSQRIIAVYLAVTDARSGGRQVMDMPRGWAPDLRSVSWSPDGLQLAISMAVREYGEKQQLEILVLPASGGEPRNLTQSPWPDLHPTWSPMSSPGTSHVEQTTWGQVKRWIRGPNGKPDE